MRDAARKLDELVFRIKSVSPYCSPYYSKKQDKHDIYILSTIFKCPCGNSSYFGSMFYERDLFDLDIHAYVEDLKSTMREHLIGEGYVPEF